MSARVPAEQEGLAPSNFCLELHRPASSPGRGLSSSCPSLPGGAEVQNYYSHSLSSFPDFTEEKRREQHQRDRRIWIDGERSKESFAPWQSLESMNREGYGVSRASQAAQR